jgi:hypothetical protein
VALLQSAVNYNAIGTEGDVLLESLCGHIVKRDRSSTSPADPSAVFASFELLLNNQVIPVQITTLGDSIQVNLDNSYVIPAGTSLQMKVRCDITPDAPLGNYFMQIDDSLSVRMSDAGLATAIIPLVQANALPLTSGEIAVTNAGLANSLSNYPNPFIPATDNYTTITYSLPEDAWIDIDIYTITGDLVTRLVTNSLRTSGSHQEDVWQGNNDRGITVAPGTYYCRIRARYASGKTETCNRKVAVLR